MLSTVKFLLTDFIIISFDFNKWFSGLNFEDLKWILCLTEKIGQNFNPPQRPKTLKARFKFDMNDGRFDLLPWLKYDPSVYDLKVMQLD